MKFCSIACPGNLRAEPMTSCSVWGRGQENMQNSHSFNKNKTNLFFKAKPPYIYIYIYTHKHKGGGGGQIYYEGK